MCTVCDNNEQKSMNQRSDSINFILCVTNKTATRWNIESTCIDFISVQLKLTLFLYKSQYVSLAYHKFLFMVSVHERQRIFGSFKNPTLQRTNKFDWKSDFLDYAQNDKFSCFKKIKFHNGSWRTKSVKYWEILNFLWSPRPLSFGLMVNWVKYEYWNWTDSYLSWNCFFFGTKVYYCHQLILFTPEKFDVSESLTWFNFWTKLVHQKDTLMINIPSCHEQYVKTVTAM